MIKKTFEDFALPIGVVCLMCIILLIIWQNKSGWREVDRETISKDGKIMWERKIMERGEYPFSSPFLEKKPNDQ